MVLRLKVSLHEWLLVSPYLLIWFLSYFDKSHSHASWFYFLAFVPFLGVCQPLHHGRLCLHVSCLLCSLAHALWICLMIWIPKSLALCPVFGPQYCARRTTAHQYINIYIELIKGCVSAHENNGFTATIPISLRATVATELTPSETSQLWQKFGVGFSIWHLAYTYRTPHCWHSGPWTLDAEVTKGLRAEPWPRRTP